MNTWLELHVDDDVLTVDPGAWPEAAALLDAVARAAESAGGRLSFRIREKFAAGDRFGFLVELERRGHEIGAHAHGRDLEASVAALRAAGVPATVMAPGLVQAGASGEAALVARAVRLGALGLTDRLELRRWTYQGWLPRRHPGGPWMLDVSVSPFDWGVLRDLGGGRVVPGELDWAALHRCARVQASWRAPDGHFPFFGATFHEHNLCAPRSITPLDPSFDALRRWVEAWRPRASAEAAVGRELEGDGGGGDGGGGAEASSPFRRIGRWTRLLGVSPPSVRRWIAPHAPIVDAESTARLPPHEVVRSATARAAVVAVHAGEGGLVERLRFLGLSDRAFAPDADLWLYARQPAGWPAPGNPAHVDDAVRVLAAAAADGKPVVLLSWSGGCVTAARALLALHDTAPELAARVIVLVDVEGPPDRHALVKPGAEREWASLSPHDDAAWVGRELVTLFPLLARLPNPPAYHRWQGSPDHVHGSCTLHAEVAVSAARAAGLVATLVLVERGLPRCSSAWRLAMGGVVRGRR